MFVCSCGAGIFWYGHLNTFTLIVGSFDQFTYRVINIIFEHDIPYIFCLLQSAGIYSNVVHGQHCSQSAVFFFFTESRVCNYFYQWLVYFMAIQNTSQLKSCENYVRISWPISVLIVVTFHDFFSHVVGMEAAGGGISRILESIMNYIHKSTRIKTTYNVKKNMTKSKKTS